MTTDAPAPRSTPLWEKGFRPFFLLAGLHGAVIVPIWVAMLAGALPIPRYFAPLGWHAHEMVFGFGFAVIAGFLLTAVGNWTKRETAVGPWLAGLAATWVAGRVVCLAGDLFPGVVVAVADLAFLPLAILAIGRPLVATANRRNMGFIGLLTAAWLANLAMHLEALGLADGVARSASLVGLDIALLVIVVVTGRIVPMFTRNATGVATIARDQRLNWLTFGALSVVTLLDGLAVSDAPLGAVCVVAGVAALGRMLPWGTRHTLRSPILWILHLGCAWLGAGLIIRGVAAFEPAIGSAGLHALTVGALGTLVLGMMARVTLGHTGRCLEVGRLTTTAFVLLTAAALVRVAGPLLPAEVYETTLHASGGLWSLAFVLYLVAFVPILLAPRADGRPG